MEKGYAEQRIGFTACRDLQAGRQAGHCITFSMELSCLISDHISSSVCSTRFLLSLLALVLVFSVRLDTGICFGRPDLSKSGNWSPPLLLLLPLLPLPLLLQLQLQLPLLLAWQWDGQDMSLDATSFGSLMGDGVHEVDGGLSSKSVWLTIKSSSLGVSVLFALVICFGVMRGLSSVE